MEKLNRVLLGIIYIILLLIVLLCFYATIKFRKYEVILKTDLTGEVGSIIKPSDYIEDIKGASIKEEDEIKLDKVGNKTLNVKLKKRKKEINYSFDINVVDTKKPIIKLYSDVINLKLGNDIDLLKFASVTDVSDNVKTSIEGVYDINKVGSYDLIYKAVDSSNNVSERKFTVLVSNDENKAFLTSNLHAGIYKDGITYIDGIMIVNKSYPLPKNYGGSLTDDTVSSYSKMKEDALKDGIELIILSGYRSYKTQKKLYNSYVESDGVDKADTYSARPGFSEHQSGYAMDLNSINDSFADTKEGIWLNNNAYKYGFILRYPKNKSDITGYKYEPWHYRYVGNSLSSILYNDGNWITLEEYYGIDSKYEE